MTLNLSPEEQEILDSLKTESREFLIKYLVLFCERALVKFSKGEKEHGGLITDRPAIPEMQDEILDLWMYVGAAIERKEIEITKTSFRHEIIEDKLECIACSVCSYYQLIRKTLFNSCRDQHFVNARWITIRLCKNYASSKAIANYFNTNVSTINKALIELENKLKTSKFLRDDFEEIKKLTR